MVLSLKLCKARLRKALLNFNIGPGSKTSSYLPSTGPECDSVLSGNYKVNDNRCRSEEACLVTPLTTDLENAVFADVAADDEAVKVGF
jgi:hypothetical protein